MLAPDPEVILKLGMLEASDDHLLLHNTVHLTSVSLLRKQGIKQSYSLHTAQVMAFTVQNLSKAEDFSTDVQVFFNTRDKTQQLWW